MKKTILLFLFALPFYISFAQMVKGKVVNDLEQPISNVNIYLDGTKTGTISADDGSFSLDITSKNESILVFKKDDYSTFTTNAAEVVDKTLKVVLLKSKEIEEVKIVPYTEEAYKNYIYFFLDSFLGNDRENVKIKNQRSLKFSYDKSSKTLRVKAPQTLIIENKNLGYTIEYNLEDFAAYFNENTTRFIGTSFFKETKSNDKVKLNRMNAFEGSQVDFFRSIFNKKVSDEGYIVNQITKFPNPKYPTEQELQKLKDFSDFVKQNRTATIPNDISDISSRKAIEPKYNIGITKLQLSESEYTKKIGEQLFLTYDHMIQINYKKYYYEFEKGKIVKATLPIVQTSYLHLEGEMYEIYRDGNTSNPDLLTNQGAFSTDKIEKLLPLDYQLGD